MSETLWKTVGSSSRFPPSRRRLIRTIQGSPRSGSPAVGDDIGLSSKPTGLADGLGRKRLAARALRRCAPTTWVPHSRYGSGTRLAAANYKRSGRDTSPLNASSFVRAALPSFDLE